MQCWLFRMAEKPIYRAKDFRDAVEHWDTILLLTSSGGTARGFRDAGARGCNAGCFVWRRNRSIGRKISATLSSTGTPSFFLHPAEALHGDLGMLARGDAMLAVSYGGETELSGERFPRRCRALGHHPSSYIQRRHCTGI